MPSKKIEVPAPGAPVRHAVSRSTGATTYTRVDGKEWTATCLNHDQSTTAPNRGAAWKTGSHPEAFCSKCKAIADGKAERITGDRLPIPSPTTRKEGTSKAAAKKAPAKAVKTAPKTTTPKATK